jgi:hypothetical protein
MRRVRVAVALVRRSGRILVERPRQPNPFRGSWDLPAVALPDGAPADRALLEALHRRHGLQLKIGALLGRAVHGIMQSRLALEIHACSLRRGRVAGSAELRWIDPAPDPDVAVSGATRKILRITASD